jgi:hypothetical protein
MRRGILGGRRARRILSPLGHPAVRRLRRAHALREAGDYAAAAREFHELGLQGEAEGIPRSVQAFLLAGQSYLLAGQRQQGLDDLRHAVEGARRFGQLDRLTAAGPRIADELQATGFEAEARAFMDSLGSAGASVPASASPAAASRPPRLPPKCPSCGGIVHPGEVEWADERSVVCDYCGSVIPGEEG